jgi:hypothetical protein
MSAIAGKTSGTAARTVAIAATDSCTTPETPAQRHTRRLKPGSPRLTASICPQESSDAASGRDHT